jgi:hypothetical protein
MQQRLTLVDLKVDPVIRMQYSLIKLLYNSLSDAFAIAGQIPKLEYDPNLKLEDEQRRKEAHRFYPQGLFSMYLDTIVNAMVLHSENDPPRCMSYGEFESVHADEMLATQPGFRQIRQLFTGFHPKNRPVLWRVLLVQAHAYRALRRLNSRGQMSLDGNDLLFPIEERRAYDWRDHPDLVSDQEVLIDPFDAAVSYLRERLTSILPPMQ